VTIFVIWYIEHNTRALVKPWPWLDHPFVGVVVAILAIYLVGLIVTSIIGKWFIRRLDALLSRVPVLRDLYKAWKHISITPGGKEGIFAKAVLIPADETGSLKVLGFTSGDPIEGDPNTTCVFVPAAPNPVNGRLLFVPITKCVALPISTEEAFKLILSTGNYIPPEIGVATGKAESSSGS
jgi:uncharacterized membrane protein